jgi:hypothetical protein
MLEYELDPVHVSVLHVPVPEHPRTTYVRPDCLFISFFIFYFKCIYIDIYRLKINVHFENTTHAVCVSPLQFS